MAELTAFLFLVVLMLWQRGAPNGVRDHLMVSGAFLTVLVVLVGGIFAGSVSFPAPPLAVMLFGIWIAVSVLWAGHWEQAVSGALLLLAGLIFLCVAQRADPEWLLFLSFAPAPGVAGLMIFEKKEGFHPPGMFENSNHSGVYLALNLLIGAWLAVNVTPWIAPFVAVVAAGIYRSGCRTAFVATGAGVASLLFFYGEYGIFALLTAFIGLPVAAFVLLQNWSGRMEIFKNIVNLIAKKPIYGWGINNFRVENWRAVPQFVTHRAHNDYLEFVFELGVVGLVLFFGIFASVDWFRDPILSAQLVVALVAMLGFFPFREVHTVLPILAVLAVTIPAAPGTVSLPLPVAAILCVAIPWLLWSHVGRKVVGLYFWVMGSRQKTREDALPFMLRALGFDANGEYVTRTILYAAKDHADLAWDLTGYMVYRYDGRLVKGAMMDQASRMAYRMGAIAIARHWNRQALGLKSTLKDDNALKFKEVIDEAYRRISEGRHGTISMR